MPSLKKQVKFIRCKRRDDILVVDPGQHAESVVEAITSAPTSVKCGHPHMIVIGKASFITRPMEWVSPAHAILAYDTFPLARVFVDALALQLGVAVDDIMKNDVLGHLTILRLLNEGSKRAEERSKKPVIHRV